ncbi:DUF3631 domain-containing protein [Methylocella sp.]|uniref:DUF3631 domain-containing protein n=1 Tax=Methylocella sp. TaxID=1978226 RepID=UPI003783C6FB
MRYDYTTPPGVSSDARPADGEIEANHAAALDWRAKGYNVVPQKSATEKRPAVKWKELQGRRATDDELRRWKPMFAGGVGFITGEISGSVVVETDGPEGEALLREFERLCGPLPPTRRVRSGSGRGVHHHFRHPGAGEHIRTVANPLIKVDVKGDGGFCVLPPSLHKSGGRYELLDDREPAQLPPGLLEFIAAKAAEAKGAAKATEGRAEPPPGPAGATMPKRDAGKWGAPVASLPPYAPAEVERLRSALMFLLEAGLLQMSDRDDWLRLGMALHHLRRAGGWPEDGCRGVWDALSELAPEKFDPQDQDKTWASFDRENCGRPVTVLSLYKQALDAGWEWTPSPEIVATTVAAPPAACEGLGGNGTTQPAPSSYETTVATLAQLPPHDYDHLRSAMAEQLGVRLSTLDRDVNAARPAKNKTLQGGELVLHEPEPWDEAVDVGKLLDEMVAEIRRYVALTPEQAQAVALWVLASYVFEAFDIFPRLRIKAPTKECGKSTLKAVIESMTKRPLTADDVSAAALFRIIEAKRPTLLVDETDTIGKENEDLRRVVNSGFERSGRVVRTAGEEFEPRTFSTYSPLVLIGIGDLHRTIESRSIVITMERKAKADKVDRFRRAKADRLRGLGEKAARFAADHGEELKDPDPDLPEELSDRAQDCWRPLIAVADVAGSPWGERARTAALVLSGKKATEPDESLAVMMLSDVRDMFEQLEEDPALFSRIDMRRRGLEATPLLSKQKETDRARSIDVALYLNSLVDRPWPGWNRGRGVSPVDVARKLKGFGAHTSKKIRIADESVRGYDRADFARPFERYL